MNIRLDIRLAIAGFAALLLASVTALSQEPGNPNSDLNRSHVTWDYVTPELSGEPGETVVFQFRANMKPKVYMYTQKVYPDSVMGPIATTVSVGGSKLIKKAGSLKASKKAKEKFDENLGIDGMDVAYWDGQVTFSIPLKISESAKPGSTEATLVTIEYQTCDDKSCKPPFPSNFNFDVKILEPKQVGIDTAATIDSLYRAIASTNAQGLELIDRIVTRKGAPVAGGDVGEGDAPIAAPGDAGDDDEDADPDAAVASGDAPVASEGAGEVGTEEVAVASQGGERRQTYNQVVEEKKKNIWAYLLFAMGAGLLALTTPCVYPMIPITVSFFTKREQASHWHAVRDALVYGAGIMFTFTGLGVLITLLFGPEAVGLMATNPWVNIFIAAIFVAFALSLFGLFEIQVPSALLNKLNAKANEKGAGLTGILLMGLVFSLTSFTCTVPFVGPTLVALKGGGEWFLPVIGMLGFSLVFALPFILLAMFPSLMKAMPKSGGWLNAVKVTMGFVEIAAAMKFLSNTDLVWDWGLLTRELVLSVWISLTVLASLYLLGRFRLSHDSPMEKIGTVRMLFSMGFLAIGFWLLTGLFGGRLGTVDAFLPPQEYPGKGNTSILAAILPESEGGRLVVEGSNARSSDRSEGSVTSEERDSVWITAEGMDWVKDDYKYALAEAKKTGKPIFIDFTGYTCTNCRWVEAHVFTKKEVQDLMNQYVLVRLYTDRRESSNVRNRQMQIDRFKTIDLPYYVVVTPDDKVVDEIVYTENLDDFKNFLQRGIAAVKGSSNASEDVAAR